MKRLIGIFIFCFTATSFAHSTGPYNYKPKFSPKAKILAELVPTGFLKVEPGTLYFPNGIQKEKLFRSFKIIEAVINSRAFKEKVIGYVGSDGKRAYTSNKGLTNEEVYETLMKGEELMTPNTQGEMNFDLTWYNRFWSKVIAYTSPGKSTFINVNWRFYKNYDEVKMAANITHEWIHLSGFYHDSARDHDSVPYAIGYIMEDLAQKYLETGYLD